MKKRNKIIIGVVLIFILTVGVIVAIAAFFLSNWTNRNVVTDITQYETYFGPKGIHRSKDTEAWRKTRESYIIFSEIFPEQLPESSEVEDFYYEFYDPWDPNYLCYLVYRCNEADYQAETERLSQLPMPENYLVYGATEFPYPVLAVTAGEQGYIYAMADESQQRLIYVELCFFNFLTDIDYEKVIPQEYLPVGFDAKTDNATRNEHFKK